LRYKRTISAKFPAPSDYPKAIFHPASDRAQWADLDVTLNSKRTIVMNRAAYEKLNSPEAFMLLYEDVNKPISLMPAPSEMPNAYPAARSGKHGAKDKCISPATECSIVVKEPLEFANAEIDPNGVLIIDLRTARISNRALDHPTQKEK
jgi:hypothetical protein